MNRLRHQKAWIVFIAVLLLFTACKGETPTAPPTGTGNTPGGSTPPPTGVNITVGVSNANPLVDSSVVVTATVTENGAAVPNGTAVEFRTTAGVLDGGATSIVKTTTNGVATATLTSSVVGLARITVTVNNVAKQQDVNFVARPVTPVPPNTSPTITSVTPTIGKPAGGQTIRITGTNFKAPVRVLFRFAGQATPTEATVVSSTDTTIDVITPGVNLGAGQQVIADIIVITQAGTTTENRAELAGAFTFRNDRLTPVLFSITPNSGPVTGGTRVTLVGEAFQEPVQVLFDTAEARVINVKYGEILVETPAGRDTTPDGSGPVLGSVNVTVRNLNSQTSSTLPAGFNYKAAMAITGVTVVNNRMTIDGNGFVGPVIVVIRTAEGDIGLQPISVFGTRIIALIPDVIPSTCGVALSGPLVVTNIVNGDQATGPTFTFPAVTPSIVNINPSVVTFGVDSSVSITVANAIPGTTRFQIGGKTMFPTGAVDNGNGTVTFTVPIPTNLTFTTETCPGGGVRQVPLSVDVVYDSSTSGCDDTVTGGLTVNPASNACVAPPAPEVNVVTPVPPSCLTINTTGPATPANGTIRIENTGTAPLTVGAVATPAQFTILPASASIPPGGFQDFLVTFTPAGADVNGNAAFTTNDADEPTINVCLVGNVP